MLLRRGSAVPNPTYATAAGSAGLGGVGMHGVIAATNPMYDVTIGDASWTPSGGNLYLRPRALSTGDPWPTSSAIDAGARVGGGGDNVGGGRGDNGMYSCGSSSRGSGLLMVDGYVVPVALEDQDTTAMYEKPVVRGADETYASYAELDDPSSGGQSYHATAVYAVPMETHSAPLLSLDGDGYVDDATLRNGTPPAPGYASGYAFVQAGSSAGIQMYAGVRDASRKSRLELDANHYVLDDTFEDGSATTPNPGRMSEA